MRAESFAPGNLSSRVKRQDSARQPLAARLRVCEAEVKGQTRAYVHSPDVNGPQQEICRMEWNDQDQGKPRLGVGRMALALVIAAFLGGVLGLVWHSSGLFGGDADDPVAAVSSEGD
jgi:hypothetical protein